MLVSVILPIRNEAACIGEVLAAVLAQDYPHDLLEVIVIDGMSEDGTRDIVQHLAAQDARLRTIDNPQRITPTALNLGIRAARGDVIVRVDGHGVLPPNYVRECVVFLKAEDGGRKAEDGGLMTEDGRRKAEDGEPASLPRSQILAGCPQSSVFRPPSSVFRPPSSGLRPLAVGGAWDCVGRGSTGAAIALATSSRFGVGGSRYRTCGVENQPILTDSVPFWAMRREVFEHIGLFREEMLCHEDYEFNFRLRQSGGKILLLPWLRSKYYVRSTLGGLARQYWKYGIWKGRFLCSHPGSLGGRHLVPPVFLAVLGACAVAALFGKVGLACLSLLLGLYGCFLLVATASLARRGSWGSAHLLPLALATLHVCWGSGVWVGLLRGRVAGQPPRLKGSGNQ